MEEPCAQEFLAQLRTRRPFDLEAFLVEILQYDGVETIQQPRRGFLIPHRDGNPLLDLHFPYQILAGNEHEAAHGREGHENDEDWGGIEHA
jgi:hypothetical protein